MQRIGNYWHMLPEFAQGRKAIWMAVNPRTGKRRIDEAFPKEIRANTKDQEMMIEFLNGSIWQLVGSDSYDKLVGSPPIGIVFSEWALANPMAWAYLSPVLEENNGWAIFIYCVSPDTLVFTEEGIVEIGEISDNPGYSAIDLNVYGKDGFHKAEQFYRSGKVPVKIIKTEKGYELTCTHVHPIWDGFNWINAEDLQVGDMLPIQHSQNVFGTTIGWQGFKKFTHGANKEIPFVPDVDFYYFLGLFVAEGYHCGTNAVITIGDDEPHDFLKQYGFKRYSRRDQSICSNSNLCALIDWFDCGKGALNKKVPKDVLKSPQWAQVAFLRGYFDGDGCATKRSTVHCDSISEKLIKTIQIMLLNFGIFSRRMKSDRLSESKNYNIYGNYPSWRLEIEGADAGLFFKSIGFKLKRKQNRARYNNDLNSTTYLDYSLLEPGYFKGLNEGDTKRQFKLGVVQLNTVRRLLTLRDSKYLSSLLDISKNYRDFRITSIKDGESEVVDFVIPETHSFVSNGFVSHNTSRGNNHGKTMYYHAKVTPGWFAQLLSADQTPVFKPEQLEHIRQEYVGIFGDEQGTALFDQEYFCSFEGAVWGAYFGKQMALARKEGRIKEVPHQPAIEVDTFWDLGVDDSMTIWFIQHVGTQHQIIDYYESTGFGLEHYAKALNGELSGSEHRKNYRYGNHFMPHDANAREMTNSEIALSRKEVAEDLGIKPIIVVARAKNMDLIINVQIPAARRILATCWFDEKKCVQGINALENYKAEYDEEKKVLSNRPLHDYASHGSSAFITFAVGYSGLSLKDYPDE